MPKKDPRVDGYISKAEDFAKPILKHLRKLIHEGCPEVEETIKWQFPAFMYKGILCGMAAFKQHCTFGFWKGDLFLGKNQQNGAMGSFGRITKLSGLPSDKIMLGYIKEAKRVNDSELKLPRHARPTKQELAGPG